jgi:cell division protein FtsB
MTTQTGDMTMAPSIDTKRCWSDRIESLFDQAIERLWFAEGKAMRRTILEQARELALEQLGIWDEYRQLDEMRRRIERLKSEYDDLELGTANVEHC